MLSLYALLIWRALRILTMAKNLYGAMIAGGIVAMLHVPGVRKRRHDRRDHADHRGPAAADELRRLVDLSTFLALGILQSIYGEARTAAASKGRVLTFRMTDQDFQYFA